MKPHTVLTTTVPCHFGKNGRHTVTIGADEDGKLVHISSDCDNLDPDVRSVANGLLGIGEEAKQDTADCCARFVEEFVDRLGSVSYHRTGMWGGMDEIAHSFWRRVSLATEEARNKADRDRKEAGKADLRPEFVKRLQHRLHQRTGMTALRVSVDWNVDEYSNHRPVYPYHGLRIETKYGGVIASYERCGIWSISEESNADLSNVTKTDGLHAEVFRHDINHHDRSGGKWRCPCCGSKTNRIEQHCRGNRHRKKFWDAIDNGLEVMNLRLVREKKTGEQER